jgi:hypothetical protein
MSKFYIKFLAILGVFLISTSSTFAATYYNCAYDITNAANWYTDSGCSTPAGVVPTVGDIGELVGAGASAPGIVTIDYTLNLQSGATLEFYSAGNTLTGTINVNSGSTISFYAADTINITGNNTGNLNGGGVINFSSTSNVYFYDGILNISPGQSLSFDGTGTVFGTYINPTFGAGSIININSGARLEVNGITVNMTSTSTNYNTGNIAGSGILNIATSSILFVSGGTLNISGGFSVGSGASSNGLFECTSGANINVSSDVGVYNNGTVNTACNVNINSPGSIKIYPGGSLTNSSFFYIFSGASLQNIGGTIDAGDYLLVYTGGSFSTLSGTTIVHNFGSFGSTTISNGASFTLNGTFDNYGDFLNHGNVTFTGGYSWYGYATSTFRNFSDGYMDLGSTISQNEGAIINEGTMIFGSGQFIQIAGASILNSLGAFFTSLAEIIMPNITFTNLGWFNFGDGAVITNNAGTFTNSSTGTFNASSTATFTTNAGGTSINNNPTSFALTDSSFPFDINSVNPLTNYNVTRSHTPTSYSISILPDGLTFSTTTGIISGIPEVQPVVLCILLHLVLLLLKPSRIILQVQVEVVDLVVVEVVQLLFQFSRSTLGLPILVVLLEVLLENQIQMYTNNKLVLT